MLYSNGGSTVELPSLNQPFSISSPTVPSVKSPQRVMYAKYVTNRVILSAIVQPRTKLEIQEAGNPRRVTFAEHVVAKHITSKIALQQRNLNTQEGLRVLPKKLLVRESSRVITSRTDPWLHSG